MKSNLCENITGVILAGGRSSRFGSNKALTLIHGKPLVQQVADTMALVFAKTMLVTNTPDIYTFLGWQTTHDRFAEAGPLAGIHAALTTMTTEKAFIVGCDMPFLNPELISHICLLAGEWDAVIPRHSQGIEPLHALYTRNALEPILEQLEKGERKLSHMLKKLHVKWLEETEIIQHGGSLKVFHNVNRPRDLMDTTNDMTSSEVLDHDQAP